MSSYLQHIHMRDDDGQNTGLHDFCHAAEQLLGHPPDTLIEIGSYRGESAEIFATTWPGCRITCVDIWDTVPSTDTDSLHDHDTADVFDDFRARSEAFDLSWYRTTSMRAATLPVHPDIVYIDGSHRYEDVIMDIAAWASKAPRLLCGHDYLHPGFQAPYYGVNVQAEVTKAVNYAIDRVPYRLVSLHRDGSWIAAPEETP